MYKTIRRTYITLPNGDLINIAEVHSVKLASKGVTLFGANNKLTYFCNELDTDMATLVRDELVKSVEAAAEGRKYQPQWGASTNAA